MVHIILNVQTNWTHNNLCYFEDVSLFKDFSFRLNENVHFNEDKLFEFSSFFFMKACDFA
jgi:predicted secreted protein